MSQPDDPSALYQYVIYDRPREYPDHHLVVRWKITASGEPLREREWAVSSCLEAARETLPPGLYCLPRDSMDDISIVETWT